MNSQTIRYISECFVKPQYVSEESKQPFYLTPFELVMLPMPYIQTGLLFAKPQDSIKNLLDRLKSSLSITLVHFYPFAGRLATRKEDNPPSYLSFVDCNNSPGAKLIHAKVDMTISDYVSSKYVPLVPLFFDHDGAINYDGHTTPLLSIQVTQLIDGVFIGCSMNHAIGDGTTFWHFLNTLSEVFQAQGKDIQISRPPVLKRWFLEGHGPLINLPFTHRDEFIKRIEVPQVLERMFHFSAESIAKLKERANLEFNTSLISSFQSLSAHVWRCITKARCVPNDQIVVCKLTIDNRSRSRPPLSPDYFGCMVQILSASTTAGELLGQNLGWAAWQLHQVVINHTNKSMRDFVDEWLRSPFTYEINGLIGAHSIFIGSSPRFNMYGNEFGLGKALTVRSGSAAKVDGNIVAYPGSEGGGSIVFGISLEARSKKALESDEEFMAFFLNSTL